MRVKLSLPLFLILCFSTAIATPFPPAGGNYYCQPNGAWIGPTSDSGAALPRTCINTEMINTPSSGNQILVPAGSSINTYLARAQCGDILMLSPGQYLPFTLPAKNCDPGHWIRIQSGATSGLPGDGIRITPCSAGIPSLPFRPPYLCQNPQNAMATISSLQLNITAAPGANYYRIGPGIELTRPDNYGHSAGLVRLAGSDHIIFDRVWAHGTELAAETGSGFIFDGATNIAVINSYLNDFKCIAGKGGSCTDAHAISGGDDPQGLPEGTWKVYDDFLEASGENIIFGGAKEGTTTPEDIEVRLDHFFKDPAWNPRDPNYVQAYPGFKGFIVKNIFELKNAQRVLFEGNLLEYSWGGFSQTGFAILLTPRGTWGHVYDVTIRFNHISHIGTGFQLAAARNCTPFRNDPTECRNGSGPVTDSGGAARLVLHDVLADDVESAYFLGTGSMGQVSSELIINTPLNNVVFDHITFVTNGVEGFILDFGTSPANSIPQMGPFTLTNSIVRGGANNGIWSVGKPSVCAEDTKPIPTFSNCFSAFSATSNLVVGWGSVHPGGAWPAGNQSPVDYSTVFVNPLLFGGDYHVLPPYQNAGTDGKDLGADIDTIAQFMQRAE